MNTLLYSVASPNHNFGEEIDGLILMKEQAKINLSKAKMTLLDHGVKTVVGQMLIHLPNLDVAAYQRCNNQEFYWEAEYIDGSILKQFSDGKQHHFGNIEVDKLKEIRWVSNFVDNTDNQDKRVILKMDWATGTFSLLNGFVLQEVRTAFGIATDAPKKLILKMVKRQSVSVDIQSQAQGEVVLYNRYLLGWENDKGIKNLMCVEPNGYVHFWHE